MERKWFNCKDSTSGVCVTIDANEVIGAQTEKELVSVVCTNGLTATIAAEDFARLKSVIGYPFGEFEG